MKKLTSENTKKFLQGLGAFAGAVSGISLGLLSLLRVFYPDPKPQAPQQPINNGTTTQQ